jgi:mRNA interferase MazF
MAYSAGEVVLVPFPYRDQPGAQARPGVLVSCQAYNYQHDIVVAAITTRAPRRSSDYALLDWQAAGLQSPSTVRMLITTLAETRVLLHIGRLSDRDWAEVQKRILQVFQWP